MSQIVLYSFHSTLILSFYVDVALTRSICIIFQADFVYALLEKSNMCFSSLLQFCPVKYTHSFVSFIWLCYVRIQKYGKTSSISRTLEGNEIADHSDRRCSNQIFIFDLTPGFNGFGKDNCKRRRETFKVWHSVRFILEVW